MKSGYMLLCCAWLFTIAPACALAQQGDVEITLTLKKPGGADSSRYSVQGYSFHADGPTSGAYRAGIRQNLSIELAEMMDGQLLQWTAKSAVALDGRLVAKNIRTGSIVAEAVFRRASLLEATEIFYAGDEGRAERRASIVISPATLELNRIPVKMQP